MTGLRRLCQVPTMKIGANVVALSGRARPVFGTGAGLLLDFNAALKRRRSFEANPLDDFSHTHRRKITLLINR